MSMEQKAKEYIKRFPSAYNYLQKVYGFYHLHTEPPVQKQIQKLFENKSSVFFVQVGSNDGLKGDPIRSLITRHKEWKGIFIEPVGFLFERLKNNYNHEHRFIFENVAIGTEEKHLKFYYVSEEANKALRYELPYWYDQLGSFDKNHIFKHLGYKIEPYIVEEDIKCVPIQEIFDRNSITAIDLLHIDTEGFDYKILSQVNFERYQPLIILYEHRHLSLEEREKAKSLLKTVGYALVEYRGDTLATFRAR